MKPGDEIKLLQNYTTGSISLKTGDLVIFSSGSLLVTHDNTAGEYWVGMENSGSFYIPNDILEKTGRNVVDDV